MKRLFGFDLSTLLSLDFSALFGLDLCWFTLLGFDFGASLKLLRLSLSLGITLSLHFSGFALFSLHFSTLLEVLIDKLEYEIQVLALVLASSKFEKEKRNILTNLWLSLGFSITLSLHFGGLALFSLNLSTLFSLDFCALLKVLWLSHSIALSLNFGALLGLDLGWLANSHFRSISKEDGNEKE